ncbi:MAG TPA: nitrate reductase molybdenum cofactor assembly chaperone [Nocardioidaceae bacterium]|nr:nitrate reductase molybdenum cofactor assembly chaperone [Nocardioidaceae bacterium]
MRATAAAASTRAGAEAGAASAGYDSTAAVSPFKLASVLLQYPTQALFAALDDLAAVVSTVSPRESRAAFGRFVDWLRVKPGDQVAQHYVETFDLRRRCALYLTYFRYGDTRERGMSLLTFKSAYRAAGFVPTEDELPDYLPMVLDFAALSPPGERLLRSHRADVELLHRALRQSQSPYADVVLAVRAQLPRLGRREVTIVDKAWQEGPPKDSVGLEPFAPPEYLTGEAARR